MSKMNMETIEQQIRMDVDHEQHAVLTSQLQLCDAINAIIIRSSFLVRCYEALDDIPEQERTLVFMGKTYILSDELIKSNALAGKEYLTFAKDLAKREMDYRKLELSERLDEQLVESMLNKLLNQADIIQNPAFRKGYEHV